MTIRELYEMSEDRMLSPYAVRSSKSLGRKEQIPDCDIRTCFQRDVDRITHSKAFRRLKKKTQVFLRPMGDHYRTRLTHTLEVSRIARTIARALRLNEDLVEAMSLAHDLGHTPFGHSGEDALNEIVPGGFMHNFQGVRVLERLEKDGTGLNLCREVLDGVLCHTGPDKPSTLEGKVLRLADRIAYINHDIDDAVRAGILKNSDIPGHLSDLLGEEYHSRIDTMVKDVIFNSTGPDISMSPGVAAAMDELREFLFENVYRNPVVKGEETNVREMLRRLYFYYLKSPDKLPEEYRLICEEDGVGRAVCDYIAGMTDSYAVGLFEDLFVPKGWSFIGLERIEND
jgi:dGTPase